MRTAGMAVSMRSNTSPKTSTSTAVLRCTEKCRSSSVKELKCLKRRLNHVYVIYSRHRCVHRPYRLPPGKDLPQPSSDHHPAGDRLRGRLRATGSIKVNWGLSPLDRTWLSVAECG